MISVGIDVAKNKSTVCILKPYGEIVCKPFDIAHTNTDLHELVTMISRFDDEVKVVMESTGIYHLPILTYLQEKHIFVAVINPYLMKLYRNEGDLRRPKTDKIDARIIAYYGIEKWFSLKEFLPAEDVYAELKMLSQQYRHHMELHISSLQNLTHVLDYTMPGIKNLFASWKEAAGRDKLSDFVERFWHYDTITCYDESDFIIEYQKWAKEKKYHQSTAKAKEVYAMAHEGIPTLSSKTPSVKMLVLEAVKVLKEIDATLMMILARMQELSKSLPEYSVVRSMAGVGDVLAPKLIAEIGDVRRFHNSKALIAYAGIDVPPYEFGQLIGNNRRITKRGSSSLRKVGYEVMRSVKAHSYTDDSVYLYIIKKESEGKAKKAAKIAGLNKFLRIYYARVKEVYDNA